MEGLIIFNSKYGPTSKYASWLGNELNVTALAADKVTKEQISAAEYLVIGTFMYREKLRMKKWLKKDEKIISTKKLFLFVVNAGPPPDESKRIKIVEVNLPTGIRPQCEVFFLPGRLIYIQLYTTERAMARIAKKTLKDPIKRKAIKSGPDEAKSAYLEPIKEAIKAFRGKAAMLAIGEIS